MSLNETNSFQPSQISYMRTTFRGHASEEFMTINKLIDECKKYSITIIQLPDKRLQAGLNIIPLKAKRKDLQQTVIVFVTKFNEKNMTATAYFDGKKIERANASNQEDIARLIKKWLESRKSIEDDYQKQSLNIIQKLNKKCTELTKQQKNEMIAVQKLKSTQEYQSLVEHQIQLSMQIESLSELLIGMQAQIQNQNPILLQKILPIETLKNQIQEYQYEYEELCKCFRNAKDQIGQMLQKQQEKVQIMQIKSEGQLNQFLVEAKKLKKLELQKRFLL